MKVVIDRIGEIGMLIDQVVYRLYGLSEEGCVGEVETGRKNIGQKIYMKGQ